ncbi:hypothetical protein [Streptomyces sp. GESEQ-4]|uniref:hypothetical protein n=1 Tax=Streptomyces sp. GESEQ-4 TaxID=2812655 RepID=UPI001B33A316|nr:hypothetical protein [Streptomyces sp. GESEQ-4]
MGWYLHRLAKANHTLPSRLAEMMFPFRGKIINRRADGLWDWHPQALPRFSIMTGLPEEILRTRLPAIARIEARSTGADVRPRRNHYIACRKCMRLRFEISEPVLAHLPASLRLCHRHGIWLDAKSHWHIGHLPELITAQRKHLQLAARFPDTLDIATAETTRLVRSWLLTRAQPELLDRWQARLAALPPPPRHPEYTNLLRRRYDERELIATYPEFVAMLGLIADEDWRSRRFSAAARRIGVATLKAKPKRKPLHNDPLFRWVDPRGRVRFGRPPKTRSTPTSLTNSAAASRRHPSDNVERDT